MKRLLTPTEVRQEVERQIGRPLSDKHWNAVLALVGLRRRSDDPSLAPVLGPGLHDPVSADDLAALLKVVAPLKAAVSAVWKQKRWSPGHWSATCGAGFGCGKRLAEYREEYGETSPEPGYRQGKDGVYRRSSRYREVYGATRRAYPRKWRVDAETKERFGYRPEEPTKVRVPLSKGEMAYLVCHNPHCEAINYVGPEDLLQALGRCGTILPRKTE